MTAATTHMKSPVMGVRSPAHQVLEMDMKTCAPQPPLFEEADPEWVADLFDTMRAGDLDSVVDRLDEVIWVMRKAAKARRILASINAGGLRAGLELSNQRASS